MNTDYKVGDLVYDSQVYDGMNTNLDDLEFYKNWLPKNNDAQILELCCGTGRLTIPIAKDGYSITGVDYTHSMLQHAKEKAKIENVIIEFIEADILNLNLPNQYDFIFIPFNSIHHLYQNEDLFTAFEKAKKHLKKEGLFLFDCYNPNIKYITENEGKLTDIANFTTSDGRNVLIKQIMRYENKTQINRIEWHYYINETFHSIQNLDMRMFFPQELDSYLKFCDFDIIHKFGDFDQNSFNDHSEKQIFVCKKK